MEILNVRRPAFWIIIVLVILLVVTGTALLANPLAKDRTELADLNDFSAAIMRRQTGLVDRTADYKSENPEFITERMKVLVYSDEPNERILAGLADDQSVENLVNERLAKINNPLIHFERPIHLYIKGNLIVEYAGSDETLLKSLTELLGSEWPNDVPYQKMPVSAIISTVSQVPLTNREISDELELRIIQPIIAACDHGQENWPGKPAGEIADKTQIRIRRSFDSKYTEYTLFFDDDDSAYLIANQTGRYCRLDDARKSTLLELARKGFYETSLMTVRVGDKEIFALGHWVYSYDKITKLSADGLNMTARNMKQYLTWLPIENVKDSENDSQTLTVSVNGQVRYGDFNVYDLQTNQSNIIKPSGQSPQQYSLQSLAPGRYIVELRVSTNTFLKETGYQYFFGVIVE